MGGEDGRVNSVGGGGEGRGQAALLYSFLHFVQGARVQRTDEVVGLLAFAREGAARPLGVFTSLCLSCDPHTPSGRRK